MFPLFVSVNVFSFQQFVNFKRLFIENKKGKTLVGGISNKPVLYIFTHVLHWDSSSPVLLSIHPITYRETYIKVGVK